MGEPAIHETLTPRKPRQQVLLGAEICGFGGGAPTKHRIKDLSVSGARIDRADGLKPGATVLVSVGVLKAVGATVIWVKDDLAGLRFAETIDPDAARSKAMIAPPKPRPAATIDRGATAGWIRDLDSPYRR
ncbi:PilZ domain-containing protein [Sphingomonas sp.]|uniref:PilZ domain-containing protein n=1 Tax=Sphingomonas sp. TaxID=28214 RepID=UPI003BACC960